MTIEYGPRLTRPNVQIALCHELWAGNPQPGSAAHIAAKTVHPSVTIGAKDEIVYSGTATELEAKALGESLQTIYLRLQDRGVSAFLSKGQGGTVVSFMVQDGAWDDPEVVAYFNLLGHIVVSSVGGLPIRVRLLNTKLESKKEIPIE